VGQSFFTIPANPANAAWGITVALTDPASNQEATDLLRFQTAYEAAARIISTVQQLSTVTLNMGTTGGY